MREPGDHHENHSGERMREAREAKEAKEKETKERPEKNIPDKHDRDVNREPAMGCKPENSKVVKDLQSGFRKADEVDTNEGSVKPDPTPTPEPTRAPANDKASRR